MPGIVGLVCDPGAPYSLETALHRLRHFDSNVSNRLNLHPSVQLGQVWRDDADAARGWFVDGEGRAAVLVSGSVIEPGRTPRRLGAADLCERFLLHGSVDMSRYDGSFVAVVLDLARGELSVHNDRLGSLPVFYTSAERLFCFAPEAKGLFAATGEKPRLSRAGVISFLTAGYCLGKTSMFEGASVLEPGCVIEVDLDTCEAAVRRTWKLRYVPSRELARRGAAEGALCEAVLHGHGAMVCDSSGPFDLLLSGGLDSRGNLAALDRIGRAPRRAFAWGLRDDIPGSDPFLARRIADDYGVPFEFLAYDTGEFVSNAEHWCDLSELANDNVGWYAEGAPVLTRHYRSGADFVVTGDEAWGVGGFVTSRAEARSAVLPAELTPALSDLIADESRDEAAATYDAEILAVTDQCESEHWLDVKDFLYVHGRLARFVFSLGYYKEHAVEVRRPFLTGAVLDVVQRLPAKHRVYKNAFVSMMRRYFPQAMAYPDSSVDSLPDWEHDVRACAPLREAFLRLLEPQRATAGVLGGLVDRDRLAAYTRRYFDAEAAPMTREPEKGRSHIGRMLPDSILRRSARIDRLRKLLRRGTVRHRRGDFDTLHSIALVVMLEAQLERFARAGTRA